MALSYFRDLALLFLGDLVVFAGSLWLALVARHFVAPNSAQFFEHLVPFSFLFALWLVVFVIVGLYDRHVALFEHKLPATITEAQVINMVLAVLFFFVAPIAIQPKTILALYFIISTALIVVWRLGLFRLRAHGSVEKTVVVGTGSDCEELVAEIRNSPQTRLECAAFIDTSTVAIGELPACITHAVKEHGASSVILDPRVRSEVAEKLLAKGIFFFDAAELYEALFSRVALTMLDRDRFLERALSRENQMYAVVKRVADAVLAFLIGILSLLFYPLVWVGIYFQDRGPVFYQQERVGQGGRHFAIVKFRSMSGSDQGADVLKSKLRVTPLGAVLRKTRIDELPQLWNVLRGDLSLIGPRPELPLLVEEYQRSIPHYSLRHTVKPGLSGWAQIYHHEHPHHGTDERATRDKLAYDLYYIKHRSLMLDLDITLKTIRTLLTLAGK